jgi:hypothetical protein
MTNLAPAHTLDQGHVQATGGGQVNANQQFVDATRQVGTEALEAGTTEEDVRQLAETLLGAGLFAPSPTFEGMARVGLVDKPLHGLEAGVRYNGSTLKGDLKLQWLEAWNGRAAGSVQLGVGHQFSAGPSALNKLGSWSRTDLDLMAPFGLKVGKALRAWAAPRVIWSSVSADPKTDQLFGDDAPDRFREAIDRLFRDESLWYAGMNVGVMVGYQSVFLALEASVMHVFFKTDILGEERDLSGLTVVPAGGLVLRF